MNAKIYILSDDILLNRTQNYDIKFLSKTLFTYGFKISNINILPSEPSLDFDKSLELNSKQNLYFYMTDNIKSFKLLINKICEKLNLTTSISETAKSYIEKRFACINKPIEQDEEILWNLPNTAHVVGCIYSNIQGVVINDTNDSYIICPTDKLSLNEIFKKCLEKTNFDLSKYKFIKTYKTFGLRLEDVKSILSDLIKNKDKISITTFSEDLDVQILIKSKDNKEIFDSYCNKVYSRLNKYIYAQSNQSLEQTLNELILKKEIKLSIFEQFTHGNVVSNLLNTNPDIKQNLQTNYVCSDSNKILSEINSTNNPMSITSDDSYNLALHMLNKTNADLVCCTLGYETENTKTCFISIGDKKSIHVYKTIFTDSLQNAIMFATKSVYFYLIKKLIQN